MNKDDFVKQMTKKRSMFNTFCTEMCTNTNK